MSGQSKDVYHIYVKPPFSDFIGKFDWYNEYADLECQEIKNKLKELEDKCNENK